MFDREHEEHLDADTLQDALERLIAAYPEAAVSASRADGVIVEMPESIPLQRNFVLKARSGLDLVKMEDAVLKGWERALAQGAARYPVHPFVNTEIERIVYGLDLRERHGVVLTLSVFPASEDVGLTPETIHEPDIKPRFATICKDERGVIVKVDDAMSEILGWSSEEMVGVRSTEFIHPDDRELAIDNWIQMLAAPGPGRRVRLRHRHRDDSWVWFEATNHNLLEDPAQGCVISEMVDITEEMAAHEELKAREQLLDGLAEAIPVGLFQVDPERRIVYTNDRLHEILGVERVEQVADQLATVIESDRPKLEGALDEVLGAAVPADIEVELAVPPNGEVRFCTVSLRPLSQDNGPINGAIACVADITDSARMREELERRATFDELTGCYNRASIMRALEANIALGDAGSERAVVFVDLDRFKSVNDGHGHGAGDELLEHRRPATARLRARRRHGRPVRRRRVPDRLSRRRRSGAGDAARRAARSSPAGGGPDREGEHHRAGQHRRGLVTWDRRRCRRDRRPSRPRDVRIQA